MIVLLGFNPAISWQLHWRRTFDFHVHAELFETPTGRFADILQPAASALECAGLRTGYSGKSPCGQRRLQWRPVAVRPGQGAALFDGDVDAAWRHHLDGTGVDLDNLRGTVAGIDPPDRFAPRRYARPGPGGPGTVAGFATSSGRIELYLEPLLALGQPPLARHVPPLTGDAECRGPYPDHPLVLGSARTRHYSNSQGRGLPNLRARRPRPRLTLHPTTAAPLGIADGQAVCVETHAGALVLAACIDPDAAPGLVTIEAGWWQGCDVLGLPAPDPYAPDSANVAPVTSAAWLDPVSGSGGVKTIPCRVTPARPSPSMPVIDFAAGRRL